MNKKNIPVVNVGISLLILIFMTLSLLTFSVLSLENAVADRRLSRKMAEHTSSYYAAVSRVQEQLAEQMRTAADGGLSAGTQFSFAQEVSDGQQLVVTVRLTDDRTGGENADTEETPAYTVTQWQLMSTEDWEADRSLNVYQGK